MNSPIAGAGSAGRDARFADEDPLDSFYDAFKNGDDEKPSK